MSEMVGISPQYEFIGIEITISMLVKHIQDRSCSKGLIMRISNVYKTQKIALQFKKKHHPSKLFQ